MGFLQFYIKLLKQFKWAQFEPRKLTFFLRKAKRACYTEILKTVS